MLPLDKEKLARERAALYERSGRHVFETALQRWAEQNPTVDCAYCGRRGVFTVHPDGTKDHAIPSAEKGDRVEPCGACKGWGFVRVSPSTKARLDREALDKQREVYRVQRAALARERGLRVEQIDRLVRRRIVGEPTPSKWVSALADLVQEFGGTT